MMFISSKNRLNFARIARNLQFSLYKKRKSIISFSLIIKNLQCLNER
jgi:hypothetical protein